MNRDEFYDNLALAHYGIKGQKRGQRRFQNEDGSLTPAGELRYENKRSGDNYSENIHDETAKYTIGTGTNAKIGNTTINGEHVRRPVDNNTAVARIPNTSHTINSSPSYNAKNIQSPRQKRLEYAKKRYKLFS